MDSILTHIKKLVGVEEEYTQFDVDIITGINTAFMTLNQIGIGPEEGFSIQDATETWNDFIGDRKNLEAVKTFVHKTVQLAFDPPQNSFLVDAINKQLAELVWRLSVQAEPQTTT